MLLAAAGAAILIICIPDALAAASKNSGEAERAAVHPVDTPAQLRNWLARVPRTRDFPPDFRLTLRSSGPAFIVEMTSQPGCLPCGDLWGRLRRFAAAHGWPIRVVPAREAALRSGRLGLPWVGHPVLWVRPRLDEHRMIPVAIGTDHDVNLARNIYLAVKMLEGVRPAVGLRAMSKFTGIIAR